MRRLTLTLIAGAATVAAGGVAVAQPAPARGAPQEMTRAAVEQRTAQAFDRLDTNHDGKLDQADRDARRKAHFDRIDTDHDGSVSYAEFTAMHAGRDGKRGERMGHGGGRGGHAMAHRGFGRGMHAGGMARLADSDGTITKAEFQAAALQRFDRLDADKDGTVTRDEAKAARDAMRQQWQARRAGQAG